MWEIYEKKTVDIIKQDVKKEFKNIENGKRWWYRDDQEIYEAWENIINKYIKQLSSADWMRVSDEKWGVKDGKAELVRSANLYKWEALRYFREKKDYFSKRWSEVLKEHWILWMYITTSSNNEKQISEIARDIEAAEKAALDKIKTSCNPKQQQSNAVEDSSVVRDHQWTVKMKNWKIERQKPLFTQSDDGTLTFTDRTNPLKIDQALGNLFKNKSKIYKIDYSACTNSNIKTKIQNTIWWLSCRIKYDKNLQTYVLTDKKWNILSDRALVWEWITIKQDTIIEDLYEENNWKWITKEERDSLKNLRSGFEHFEFDVNNYKYYEQYRQKHKRNICSSYAYWIVSDILAKQWYCFTASEVSAWEITSSSYLKWKFNIDIINKDNPQPQILKAPAWTFFTVKYNKTSHQNHWVSHVMVSLWNGVYTDLFGTRIRKIDFKSDVKFSWNKFLYRWKYYTITEDSRLLSPNISSLSEWKEQILNWENISPDDFAYQISKSTWANINYVSSLIASQNGISANNFGIKVDSLSVKIITKEIKDLNINTKEWSNDIANDFLDSIKCNKEKIMGYYPKLTNHEYDEIAKRAVWILYQESNAGRYFKDNSFTPSRGIRKEKIYPVINKIAVVAQEIRPYWSYNQQQPKVDPNYSISNEFNLSRWYTQIKFNELFKEEDKTFLKSFGVDWDNDLADARKCWIATMVWLIRKYYDYVVPIKSDSFRANDAEITKIKYSDGHVEEFARDRLIKGKKRTKQEFDNAKNDLCDKHGDIKSEEIIIRPWIKNPDDFFDFLYYAWNQPSQIKYWTATPNVEWTYAYKANEHIDKHLA